MSDWKEYKLAEVCDFISGYAFKSNDFGNFSNKVIRIGDIKPPFVDVDGATGVNLVNYDLHKLGKYEIKHGDFILAMTGATIGKIGKYLSKENSYINQRVLLFNPKANIDSQFLYYAILTKDFYSYIINHIDSESAQPNISAGTIGKYIFAIPPLTEQKKIAGILSALDEKIETNRKINARLEEMAQAIFKSWFIDFIPFGGQMPKNWEECTLGDLTLQCKDKVKEKKNIKVLSPISTGELVLSDEYFTKQVYSKELSKYIIVEPNSFAYNPARVNIGSIGMNNYNFVGCVSPVYVVFRAIEGYEEFVNHLIKTKLFKNEVSLRAIGGVRQTLNYEDFSLINFLKPSLEIVTKFSQTIAPIYNKIKFLQFENARLAELRDTLLPKLMSGEIKVNCSQSSLNTHNTHNTHNNLTV